MAAAVAVFTVAVVTVAAVTAAVMVAVVTRPLFAFRVALADGVLFASDADKVADRARQEAATGDPGRHEQTETMRKVSLQSSGTGLKDNGGTVTPEMENLAGLEKIDYVFFYPETKDIVIAARRRVANPGSNSRRWGMSVARHRNFQTWTNRACLSRK